MDASNVGELNSGSCAQKPVSPGGLFLGEVFATGFVITELGAVPNEAANLTGAYLALLDVKGEETLTTWQGSAALNLVRSVSPFELVKETREGAGVAVPDLTSFRPARFTTDFGETYREISEVITRPRFGAEARAGFVGGLVRTEEGAPVERARVIIETDEGFSEELESDLEGRIAGTALGASMERLRERSASGLVRFRVESRSGEVLERGVLSSSPLDVPAVVDLTIGGARRLPR